MSENRNKINQISINYSLPTMDITCQAYEIAILFRTAKISEAVAREILEEYFDFLVATAKKKFGKKIKKPTFAYFVRATPNF